MNDILQRIFEYQRTYAISARGHYLASARLARWNYGFGVPSVVFSAVVGASIFGTIETSPELAWKITAGLLSLLAAVLASLQTFFRFAETAELHLAAGRRYGVIRRRLELLEIKYHDAEPTMRNEALADLAELNNELSRAAEESPAIPDSCWNQARLEETEQNPKAAPTA